MKARFFKLVENDHHRGCNDYKDYDIVDANTNCHLDQICAKYPFGKELAPISGACGLLHSDKYEGYCQLFYTHRKCDDDGVVNIEFVPCYTNEGEIILIKTNTECPYFTVSNSYEYSINTRKVIERVYLTYHLKWIV